MDCTTIKLESSKNDDIPEGLLPSQNTQVPAGFGDVEWTELTEWFASEAHEINYILSLRGQGGSRKGRPTNLKVEFKKQLSNSSRAVQQRDRAALRDEESRVIESAKAADRAAQYQLRAKVKVQEKYIAMSERERDLYLQNEYETLAERRFKDMKSMEWLSGRLERAHKKWEKIEHEIGLRQHAEALHKASEVGESSTSANSDSRGLRRVYGNGGVLQKLLRETYRDGLSRLNNDTFSSKEEKVEWLAFVEGLSPEELALVKSEDWAQRKLSPLPALDDAVDAGNRRGVQYNDDECEEEIDDDSEIDEYYNQMPDEYETGEDAEDAQEEGDDESEWEGCSDSGDETHE